jgi:dephospho-CoA kinase
VIFAALTGGIASGKSTVASRLRTHGAVVIDADRVAREVVERGTPALAAIGRRFGQEVIRTDGSLDRAALGAIVFRDEKARGDLNAITHPEVWRSVAELRGQAAAADPYAVVVYDVPLLVEAAQDRPMAFDLVAVVTAPEEERVRRLVELRGMSQDEARSRIRSQASDDERLAVADVVIDAGGSPEETLTQADRLWEKLAELARRASVGGRT